MAYNAAGIVMGGRRTSGRVKSKRVQARRKRAKVTVKVKGTPEQVQKAVQKLATGVSDGKALDSESNQEARRVA